MDNLKGNSEVTPSEDLMLTQLALEEKYKEKAVNNVLKAYDKANVEDMNDDTALGRRLISHEFVACRDIVATFMASCIAPKRGAKPAYYSLVAELCDTFSDHKAELINIITGATLSALLSSHRNNHINYLTQRITSQLQGELDYILFLDTIPEGQRTLINANVDLRVQAMYRQRYVKQLQKAHADYVKFSINKSLATEFLSSLIILLCEKTEIFAVSQTSTGLNIAATQELLTGWHQNIKHICAFAVCTCPCVVQPKEWTELEDGGYYGALISPNNKLLRLHGGNSTAFARQYLRKLKQLDLNIPLKAVNAIQNTKWTINNAVLDVVHALVNMGGGRAGLPYVDTPPKPATLPPKPTKQDIKEYSKKMVPYYKHETVRVSYALKMFSTLSVADDFRVFDTIYFPHNMDFRGRIYPMTQLSPQGDDLAKALLLFADTQPLTDTSQLDWFYICGANHAGVDKVSYQDRIKWVKDNHDNILKSATDPLGYNWWQEQDEPLQFLAFCLEYARLQDHIKTTGTPVGFKTGIVVAMDGTCSGLQHFSAMLRDPIGGKAVNLLPADKPQDIYAEVAAKVNVVLEDDARRGTEDARLEGKYDKEYTKLGTKALSQGWLAFGVTRKVTKRNVMTLAYGSKQFGFKQQLIEDVIKPDVLAKEELSIFKGAQGQYANYLSKIIWDAVSTTVVKAVEGMNWLQAISKLVTRNHNVVTWTTPVGLLVCQQYMEIEVETVQLRISNKRIRVYKIVPTGNIDKRKQASSIAPNFIHSMDASHLQLTVSNCVDSGIKHFAVVHDSYGCPLSQAGLLYQKVREAFITMYTDNDVLSDIREELQALSEERLPSPPEKGSLNLNLVNESKYIFC